MSESGEGAGSGIEEDRADVGGVTNDGENNVGLGSDGVRGVGEVGSDVEEWLGFGRCAVEDGERVAGSD